MTGGSNSMGYFPYLRTITWTDNDLDLPDEISRDHQISEVSTIVNYTVRTRIRESARTDCE